MYICMGTVEEIRQEKREGVYVIVFRHTSGAESVYNADNHIKSGKDIDEVYDLYLLNILQAKDLWLKTEDLDGALAEFKKRKKSKIITLDNKVK